PRPLPSHAELLRRSGDLRPRLRLPGAGRLQEPRPDGGPGLQSAAEALRRQRSRSRALAHLGSWIPRPRAVAKNLLHRLAAGTSCARPRYGGLRRAMAWPCRPDTRDAVAGRRAVMSILVTGGTGFIGREVIRNLLDAGRSVTVLARRGNGRSAFERVSAALGGVPSDSDFNVVEGDLAMRDCGLSQSAWRWLRAVVDTVVHCAGDSRFEPEVRATYVAGHIAGPVRLLEGLATGRLVRWAHVSTAFVCGRRAGTILEHEADLGQTFNNVYERVKLDAELAVRTAGVRCGVDVRVFRPSIVVGTAPATAGGRPSNPLFPFLRPPPAPPR